MDGYFFVINWDDVLQKLYDFGDNFIFEKKNNAILTDVSVSWTCYVKPFYKFQLYK